MLWGGVRQGGSVEWVSYRVCHQRLSADGGAVAPDGAEELPDCRLPQLETRLQRLPGHVLHAPGECLYRFGESVPHGQVENSEIVWPVEARVGVGCWRWSRAGSVGCSAYFRLARPQARWVPSRRGGVRRGGAGRSGCTTGTPDNEGNYPTEFTAETCMTLTVSASFKL